MTLNFEKCHHSEYIKILIYDSYISLMSLYGEIIFEIFITCLFLITHITHIYAINECRYLNYLKLLLYVYYILLIYLHTRIVLIFFNMPIFNNTYYSYLFNLRYICVTRPDVEF